MSASAAGDVNGDGFDDMIIGSPYASSIGNTRYQAGESYIIYGDSNLPQVLDENHQGQPFLRNLDPRDFALIAAQMGARTEDALEGRRP